MKREQEIIYENEPFWVCAAKHGFEVYESCYTHSVRKAIIGFKGQDGLDRAKAECDRRAFLAQIYRAGAA